MNIMSRSCLLLLLFLTLFFTGCFSRSNLPIQLVTDDIGLLDIVDRYNTFSNTNRIEVTYISPDKLTGSSLFSYALQMGIGYDIIAGSYFPDTPLRDLDTAVLPAYQDSGTSRFYAYFADFLQKNSHMGIPYALDFPVIISLGKKPELTGIPSLSLSDLRTIAIAANRKENGTVKHVGFIPAVSSIDELSYYFMFNSTLFRDQEGLTFMSDSSLQAFEYYHLFNSPDIAPDDIDGYLSRNKKMEAIYFLKKEIVSYDICYLSELGNKIRPGEDTAVLIDKLRFMGLRSKVAAVSNKSPVKKAAFGFLGFLLEEEQQQHLFTRSYSLPDAYHSLHLPVRKGILRNAGSFVINPVLLDSYIDELGCIDFLDPVSQKIFFKAYNYAKSMEQKELITEETFLTFLTKSLKE